MKRIMGVQRSGVTVGVQQGHISILADEGEEEDAGVAEAMLDAKAARELINELERLLTVKELV